MEEWYQEWYLSWAGLPKGPLYKHDFAFIDFIHSSSWDHRDTSCSPLAGESSIYSFGCWCEMRRGLADVSRDEGTGPMIVFIQAHGILSGRVQYIGGEDDESTECERCPSSIPLSSVVDALDSFCRDVLLVPLCCRSENLGVGPNPYPPSDLSSLATRWVSILFPVSASSSHYASQQDRARRLLLKILPHFACLREAVAWINGKDVQYDCKRVEGDLQGPIEVQMAEEWMRTVVDPEESMSPVLKSEVLFGMYKSDAPVENRCLALSRLRTHISIFWDELDEKWTFEQRSQFLADLLAALNAESDDLLRLKLNGLAAEVALNTIDPSTGFQVWYGMIRFLEMSAQSIPLKISSLSIIAATPNVFGIDPTSAITKIEACLVGEETGAVREAAMRCFVLLNGSAKARDYITKALVMTVQSNMEIFLDACVRAEDLLIDTFSLIIVETVRVPIIDDPSCEHLKNILERTLKRCRYWIGKISSEEYVADYPDVPKVAWKTLHTCMSICECYANDNRLKSIFEIGIQLVIKLCFTYIEFRTMRRPRKSDVEDDKKTPFKLLSMLAKSHPNILVLHYTQIKKICFMEIVKPYANTHREAAISILAHFVNEKKGLFSSLFARFASIEYFGVPELRKLSKFVCNTAFSPNQSRKLIALVLIKQDPRFFNGEARSGVIHLLAKICADPSTLSLRPLALEAVSSLVKTSKSVEERKRLASLDPSLLGMTIYYDVISSLCTKLDIPDHFILDIVQYIETIEDMDFFKFSQYLERYALNDFADAVGEEQFVAFCTSFSTQGDWKMRASGMLGLAWIGKKSDGRSDFVKAIVCCLDDPHRNVRVISCVALGWMAKHCSQTLLGHNHLLIVPALLCTLGSTSDVDEAIQAGKALTAFIEKTPKEILVSHDDIAPELGRLLHSMLPKTDQCGKKLVEQILNSIFELVKRMPEGMKIFYDSLCDQHKKMFAEHKVDLAFESISHLTIAGGKEKFDPDASDVISTLVARGHYIMDMYTTEIDNLLHKILDESAGRLVDLLPVLLGEIDICDTPRHGFVRMNRLSRKNEAASILLIIAKKLGDAFLPHVDSIVTLATHQIIYYRDCTWALKSAPMLLSFIKQYRGTEDALLLWRKLLPSFTEGLELEKELVYRSALIDSMLCCVEVAGEEELTNEETDHIEMMRKMKREIDEEVRRREKEEEERREKEEERREKELEERRKKDEEERREKEQIKRIKEAERERRQKEWQERRNKEEEEERRYIETPHDRPDAIQCKE